MHHAHERTEPFVNFGTYKYTDMDNEKINIRLHIYDTEIMVRVPREEEALYRKGADLINELLNAYFSSFKGAKSDREITYFAMIDLALRYERQASRNDTQPYQDIMAKLTTEIEETLAAKQTGKSDARRSVDGK
jgi:hypothetical protein